MWFSVVNVLLFVVVLVACVFFYLKQQFLYWSRKGVPFRKPHWILGSIGDLVLGKISRAEMTENLYNQFEGEKFAGIWELWMPMLIIRDPDLLREIAVKDGDIWSSRGNTINRDQEPLAMHLFSLDGLLWKSIRSKLTPTFTSTKLKQMYYLLLECANAFTDYLRQQAAKKEPIDAREVSAKFTTDVIGTCAFGIQINALGDENSAFRKMGKKIFEAPSTIGMIKQAIQRGLPSIYRFFKLSTMSPEIAKFFLNLTKETIAYREANNIQRHDFLDLLRKLKNTGEIISEDDVEFDDNLLAAQVFVFFAAGFETSSSVISYCLHELALNQEIQDRLREEVREQKARDNGEITYDGLKNMKYLHMVFQETMRKYPSLPALNRTCTRNYQIPGTDVVVPAGTSILIPIYGIHHDPLYWPDPEKFDPMRFTPENQSQRPPLSYIPFGVGPRYCIGSRFAEQQTKLGIFKIIESFKVSFCEKSVHPLLHDSTGVVTCPKGGIWLNITDIRTDVD